ncbi:MAG: hypothetical protein HY897_02405 [Deltaproteobacteria bacterium]|nr:hypothetical protein [Deltaproteobacteria bacterium]
MTATARSQFFSAASLHRAYLDCRRRKRNKPGAIRFQMRLADELLSLEEELRSRTYAPRPCVRFTAHRPKFREIVAADFRDRVVHHLFVRAVEPDWEKVFIHDSFACRPGKGTHAAVDRLATFVRSATMGGRKRAFFMQADIRSFFMSMNRRILFSMLDRRLRKRFGLYAGPDPFSVERPAGVEQSMLPLARAPRVMDAAGGFGAYDELSWLAGLLVFHDPLKNCINVGDPVLSRRVPAHKTPAGCKPGCGVPIGNLTSQFFGNVYLDVLDQYVKRVLKAPHYIRYVDDIVLIHESPEKLREWLGGIERFLGRTLHLGLNENRFVLKPLSCGIDFLGYIVHEDHRLVRRRVVGNLLRKLTEFERELVHAVPAQGRPRVGPRLAEAAGGVDRRMAVYCRPSQPHWGRPRGVVYDYRYGTLEKLLAVMNSYLAHFAKANAWTLVEAIFKRHDWLSVFFKREAYRVVRLYDTCRNWRSLFHQYSHFAGDAAGGMLFFQVGSHFELLDGQAERFGGSLGLAPIGPRPGFAHRCGFHRSYLNRYVRSGFECGFMVTVVKESGMRLMRLAERRIAFRYMPATGMVPEVDRCLAAPLAWPCSTPKRSEGRVGAVREVQ